jgi:hypothetical protein
MQRVQLIEAAILLVHNLIKSTIRGAEASTQNLKTTVYCRCPKYFGQSRVESCPLRVKCPRMQYTH